MTTRKSSPRPFVVFTRCLGQIKIVARYASEEKALQSARDNRAFCKHVAELSDGGAKALGVVAGR